MSDEIKKRKVVASDKSEIVAQLPRACSDETAAVEFIEARRGWDKLPACPRCGDTAVYQMRDRETGERNRRFLWLCKGCKRQYTARTETVFEDSRIPLKHWCYAFWRCATSKKGASALEVKRHTGLSYKSALFLLHRVRWAMQEEGHEDGSPLNGTVEADETYVGGRPRHRSRANIKGRGTDKPCVLALVERGGRVKTKIIPTVNAANVQSFIRENVARDSRIMTDEYAAYMGIGRHFEGGHETVNHSHREYARGDAYTNTVEGFFSLLKRGLMGTYHSVSRKHLHRYLAEFRFRYNLRHVEDGERTAAAIKASEGKRLFYREPVAQPKTPPGTQPRLF